jgi:superfamily II DNA/RNA helicase
VPFTRQTLFFTATMPPEITRISEQFLHNPVRIEVARPSSTSATITQRLVACNGKDAEKREVLRALIASVADLKNAIIFCNRKSEVATLHKSLVRHGLPAVALHGDMDQSSRTAALDSFRKGEMTILVASDVAARGLDIPDVSHVFNYDVPHHPEDYVHRIGRTGRAGRPGASFTLLNQGDERYISAIEKLIQIKIEWHDGDLTSVPSAGDERPERRPRSDRRDGKSRGGRSGASASAAPAPARDAPAPARDAQATAALDDVAVPAPRTSERAQPEHAVPAPAAAATSERTQRAAPPKTNRDQTRKPSFSNEDGPVSPGMGDHMPAFLMRPTTRNQG